MTEPFPPDRVHVIVGAPWKDAVLCYLEGRGRTRPFPQVPDARHDDGLVVIFDCEPRLVMTTVGRIDSSGYVGAAMSGMRIRHSFRGPIPLSWVDTALDAMRDRYALFDGTAATELVRLLDTHWLDADIHDMFGESSMTAARVLLESDGVCGGCDAELNLRDAAVRDAIRIWTVPSLEYADPPESTESDAGEALDLWFGQPRPPMSPRDWPAVLCAKCQRAMRDGGFPTFLDYRFSRHPVCPECRGWRTQRAVFGMLDSFAKIAPWQDARGCCVTEDVWTCTLCGHRW